MPLSEPCQDEKCAPSIVGQPFELKRRNCIDNLEYQRSALIKRLSKINNLLERLKDPTMAEVVDLYNEI